MSYSTMISDSTITVSFTGGTTKAIHRTHPQAGVIIDAIKAEVCDTDLLAAFSRAEAIRRYMCGNVEVTEGGEVKYRGEVLHHVVADKIIQFMQEGLPFEPLVAFLNRLMGNPSFNSRQQLYGFLINQDITIDRDGYLICYKAVRSDYMDKHTGIFNNRPGQQPYEAREKCDDDPNHTCSSGLHVGSIQYVRGYANGGDRIVKVWVDPANVVSVPSDYQAQKMRVTTYLVLEDVTGQVIPDVAPSPLSGFAASTDLCSECDECLCEYCGTELEDAGVCPNCNGDGTKTVEVNGLNINVRYDDNVAIHKDANGKLVVMVGD